MPVIPRSVSSTFATRTEPSLLECQLGRRQKSTRSVRFSIRFQPLRPLPQSHFLPHFGFRRAPFERSVEKETWHYNRCAKPTFCLISKIRRKTLEGIDQEVQSTAAV